MTLRSRVATLYTRWRYLPRLVHLLWRVGARDVVVILVCAIAIGLAPLLSIISVQRLVDAAVAVLQQRTSLQHALGWALALCGANLLQVYLEAVNRWIGETTQERLKLQIQERVLARASRLPLIAFEQAQVYDQLHRTQQCLDTRLFTAIQQLVPIPASAITLVALLGYLGTGHILLPCVLVVGVSVPAVWSTHYFGKRYLLDRRQTQAERRLSYVTRLMTERPAAAEIRLLGLRAHLLNAWKRAHHDLSVERMDLARGESRGLVLRTVAEQVIHGGVLAGVVALILLGRISLGAFTSYLAAIERCTGAIYGLLWNSAIIDGDLRYIRDLLDFLDAPEQTTSTVIGMVPTQQKTPRITFDSVSFRYPDANHDVLKAVSFTLHPGERIALVGANGAGKTTLAKLLLGLYQPTGGRVLIDGVDMREVSTDWWRAQIVAVFQEYGRYAVTARETIGLGDVTRLTDDVAIQTAAARSGADAVVATLPGGYATVLGTAFDEHGSELSGGQWQKLALARAYFRDARVLVLDEPTAALDARAEVEVYRQFRDVAHGRSALLISHRLGSARLADRILVLSGGEIVEEGTHTALLGQDGQYAMLYGVQAAWYRDT